jgi:peptidoglycan/LPS O-acetylase OafA/YrhL
MKFLAYLASPWTDVNSRQSSHGDSVSVLDGIRALAVLMVLAGHTVAFGMSGQGSVGVFLFFTLSGFVLMLPFADRPRQIFEPSEAWRYFANRALRIVPAFVVAVLFLTWYMEKSWTWAWLNLSFYAGWNHLWSVAEEVRFYFLFPFVVGALALLPSQAWRMAALVGLILLAFEFQGVHRVSILIDDNAVLFYFYFFLSGMLACLIYRELSRRTISSGYTVDALAPLIILSLVYLIGWERPDVWCVIFFLLLIGITTSERAFTSRLMRSWIMRHIGLLSYSFYLFHFTVSTWLWAFGLRTTELFAATFAATYVISIASYLLIEKPFLMLKPKRLGGAINMPGLFRPRGPQQGL